MQHIEEALLHEYLDRSGESDPVLHEIETHLADCAACRARLDEVSALRTSASDILRAASPAKRPMPSFEEVAALMGAPIASASTGSKPADAVTRQPRRTYALARAATVVLVFGAGWLAHALYRTGAVDSMATESVQEPAAPQADATMQATSPELSSTTPPAPAPAVAGASTAAADAAAGDAVVSGERARTDAGRGAGADEADAVRRLRAADASRIAAEGGVAGSAGKAAANAAIGAADMSAAREQTRQEAAPAAAPPPPPSLKAAESAFSVQMASADTGSINGLLRTTQWRTVSGDAVLRAAGGSLVRVRGLAVVDYAVARDNERRIRVRQITAAGDTLEVLQMLPFLASARSLAQSSARPQIPEALRDAPLYQSIARGTARDRVYHAVRWSDDRIVVFAGAREENVSGLEPELVRTTGATR